jgi:hypothetical protein
LAPNKLTSLQTTLAADAHLAEGQSLHEEQTLNKANSLMQLAGTRRSTISKTEGQNVEPVNLNKKEYVEVMPSHT